MVLADNTREYFDPAGALSARPPEHDVSRFLANFETVQTCLERDQRLVRRLQVAGHHDLADGLQSSLERDETPPHWSNTAYRDYRRWFTNEGTLLAHGAKRQTGHFGVVASVVQAGLIAPIGGLGSIAPRDVVELMWDGLENVALASCRVIGGVDVSFNERAGTNQAPGYYQLHVALAVLGSDPSEAAREHLRDSIKSAFDLEPTSCLPVQVKELRDPVEQLSYLMKRMFVRRVSIIDSRGRRNTLSRPLKPAQEAEIAAWLSTFRQTDRLILKGLRRQGDRIVPTSPRVKRDGK